MIGHWGSKLYIYSMLDQFLDFADRHQLCDKRHPTLLAVSGGIDSTVMLYLFREAGFDFGVAHANFQLRGAESDRDQDFVAMLCKEFDVSLAVCRFDTEKYAWEKSLSTQLAARELRYEWFNDLLKEGPYKSVATAHHFDDTMETVLMNLIRGSGVDGLAGIPVRNGAVIRPMMFATRKQVENYALKRGIVWREDASNHTDNYQRNYIRHHVIPHLREINPSLDVTWRGGLRRINHELNIIQRAHDLWKERFVSRSSGCVCIAKEGIKEYAGNPAMLWRYIRNFGFNFDQAADIVRSVNGQPGKKFMSASHALIVDRDHLMVFELQQQWNERVIGQHDRTLHLGPWMLTIEMMPQTGSVDLRASGEETALLDASKLSFPLLWRKWKPGDFFYPLGLGHRKKISDFFVDEKLSLADKDRATVIESGGDIIWVSGHRIDDRFRITPGTTVGIRLQISVL